MASATRPEAPDAVIAELRRANAALQQERDAAVAREVELAEMVGVINRSPGKLAPVFSALVEKAARLCHSAYGALLTFDGEQFLMRANHGTSEFGPAQARPLTPEPGSALGRIAAGERVVHILDLVDTEEYQNRVPTRVIMVEQLGARTALWVALRKDDAVLGVMIFYRKEVRAFADTDIALLESFAAQAVIAIENARLLTEQQEALERQTATAEVLQAINASPGNLQPVFDTMLEKAMRLCGAAFGTLRGYDGEQAHTLATRGLPAAFAEYTAQRRFTPGREMAQALASGRPTQVLDTKETQSYRDGNPNMRAIVDLGGARTALLVPLVKDGVTVGFFSIYRQEVRTFSDKQIALLENFAAQAVIAMENARLITAQREALERQTASAEVLQVINASPGNLVPVFDAMLERALRLCGAAFGALHTYDGERFRMVAIRGVPPAFEEFRRQHPVPNDPETPPGRVIATGRPVQVVDVMTDPFFAAHPELRDRQIELGGVRAVLNVPLLKDGAVVGLFVIYRGEPGEFPDKQVALLEGFAAQAVIAMENARLLGALQARDADNRTLIARQAASIEVLKTISASPDDPQPVFELIARRARELCGAAQASVTEFDGTLLHMRARDGFDPATEVLARRHWPQPPDPANIAGRIALGGRVIHIRDLGTDTDYSAAAHEVARGLGSKSLLGVPLLREGWVIGGIVLRRTETGGFDDTQIALVESFAEQAVIAISSATALRELRARTEELAARNTAFAEQIDHQSATIEVLKAMSASPGDAQPVFDLITLRAPEICNGISCALFEYDGELVHLRSLRSSSYTSPEASEAFRRQFPMPPTRTTSAMRALLDRDVSHIRDVQADLSLSSTVRNLQHKSLLSVPLLRDGAAIGAITLSSATAGGFSDSQVQLLKTFAEQAVIAIRSAETFRELEARTAALAQRNSEFGERIEQQAATIDVLKVMSASPDDTQPVFDQIVRRAVEFCSAGGARLVEYDGEFMHLRSIVRAGGIDPAAERALYARYPVRPDEGSILGRVILRGAMVQARSTESYSTLRLERDDPHAVLGVPLMRDARVVGAIAISQPQEDNFTDAQVELLKTFAEQAVIAIGSVATYRQLRERTAELEESLQYQTATSEVLKAISRSVFNLREGRCSRGG